MDGGLGYRGTAKVIIPPELICSQFQIGDNRVQSDLIKPFIVTIPKSKPEDNFTPHSRPFHPMSHLCHQLT